MKTDLPVGGVFTWELYSTPALHILLTQWQTHTFKCPALEINTIYMTDSKPVFWIVPSKVPSALPELRSVFMKVFLRLLNLCSEHIV